MRVDEDLCALDAYRYVVVISGREERDGCLERAGTNVRNAGRMAFVNMLMIVVRG